MKKLFSLLAAAGLVAGSLLATALPAHADDVEVSVPGPIVVKDLVISSQSCKVIPMSMTFQTEPVDASFDLIEAWVGVWGGKVKQADAEVEALFTWGEDRTLANPKMADFVPISWCPKKKKYNVTGLGTFTVEGAYLRWWNTPQDENPNGDLEVDKSTTFTVKHASKAASAKATKNKKGDKRTISAKFTYYDVAKKGWKSLPKKTKVQLQTRAADGTGEWKTLKTVKVGSKGAVKTTNKTKAKLQYRFVYAGNSTKAPITSKTLTK